MKPVRNYGAVALLLAAGAGCDFADPARPEPWVPHAALLARPADLPPSTDAIIDAIDAAFDPAAAMDTVAFMSRFWRVASNDGYIASLERLRARLVEGGFQPRPAAAGAAAVWLEEFESGQRGWDHTRGTLTLIRDDSALGAAALASPDRAEVLLSRESHRLALCINSFSTPEGGLVAPLVDVGAGADEDFAGLDVAGTVVLGDAPVGPLWQRAVVQHGAAGVVSTALADYISPDRADSPVTTPREQWEILQWGAIPYDEERRSFGFKASPRAAHRLREELGAGTARVRVEIASSFTTRPNRTLVAEIPGRRRPAERIVLVAHVQEPGANDNASGSATLAELARAMRQALRTGHVEPPARTLTFLWLDEIRGSRRWLQDHPDIAAGVRFMFSLDMTGQDTSRTGGTFLIEKWPDPAAVWDRPSDPHSEWGRGEVEEESLRGDLINDLHLAVCARVAAGTDWVVRTNPYEGGSDHTVFGEAGIPSVLNWHFTDRFYHTNYDTPDKTSPETMRRVGVSVGTSAMLLASGRDDEAVAIAALVQAAGRARLELEAWQGRGLMAAAADRQSAAAEERRVRAAWRRWYAEALESVLRLPVAEPSAELRQLVSEGAAEFLERGPGASSARETSARSAGQ
jgi:aminopeptidase YwaD